MSDDAFLGFLLSTVAVSIYAMLLAAGLPAPRWAVRAWAAYIWPFKAAERWLRARRRRT